MKSYFLIVIAIVLSISGCSFIENENNSCYRIKDGEVFLRYYGGYPRAKEVFLKVKGADAKSFTFIENSRNGACQGGDIYAKDEHHVFYRTEIIDFADVKTFEVMGLGYSRDDNDVFYREKVVEKADAESFCIVDNERGLAFGYDKYGLLKRDQRVNAAIDCPSFKVLSNPYFKDKNSVYYEPHFSILPEADAQSFTCPRFKSIVNYQYYAYDKNNAYYYERGEVKVIPGIDFDTFEVLSKEYAKDKNNVYFKSQIIQGADVESFIVPHRINENVAQDKNHKYIDGEIKDK